MTMTAREYTKQLKIEEQKRFNARIFIQEEREKLKEAKLALREAKLALRKAQKELKDQEKRMKIISEIKEKRGGPWSSALTYNKKKKIQELCIKHDVCFDYIRV